MIELVLVTSSFIGKELTQYFLFRFEDNFLHFSKFKSARTTLAPAWLRPWAYSVPSKPDAPVSMITLLFKLSLKDKVYSMFYYN